MTMRFMGGVGLAVLLLLTCACAIGYWAHGRKENVARRRRQKLRGRRTIHIDRLTGKTGEAEPDQTSH